MRYQDDEEINKLLGRGQFAVPSPIPEEINYSKLRQPGAPADFQPQASLEPMPQSSQFRDPMSRQLLEERMNPQPQLGTQTEKALTDRQLLDKYLSDKFMQEDIAGANAVSDKAQLYAGLGGAFNAINKGLTGFETDPNAYQLMHKGGMDAPSKVLAERQAMRENLLKKYGLGVQEKESEAKLAALKADQAYKQFDMQHKDKMFELEKAVKEKAMANQLPEGVKESAAEISKGTAGKVAIAQQIDSYLEQMKNADSDTKLQLAKQMIKVLNSTEGKDAVGEGERKNLASKLEIGLGGLLSGNYGQFGRDIEGFMDDARQTSNAIKGGASKLKETYKSITGKEHPIAIPPSIGENSGLTPEEEQRLLELERKFSSKPGNKL